MIAIEPQRHLSHPIFDPDSLYCRMRNTIHADGKMLGYLLWLKVRADRLNLTPSARAAEERESHCQEFRRCSLAENAGRELDVLDATDAMACQVWNVDHFPTLRIRIALVRETNRTRSLHALASGADVPLGHYRAFLIEPEASRRFSELVGNALRRDPVDAIHAAFDPEVMANHIDVARLLASLPDLDGESDGERIRFRIEGTVQSGVAPE